jgi:hypothetical protein
MNPFRHFDKAPWTGNWPMARPLPTQDNATKQKLLAYEGVSKSFRTGRLERELQMVQLSAIMCSCIAVL